MIGLTPPIYTAQELQDAQVFLKLRSESKTISNAGVAISPDIPVTFVETDGTADLDNATLGVPANDGTIKIVACSVEGAAGDTWKITPSVLLGGTQITFAGIGLGCVLCYNSAVPGWIVVANNGGTIS